MKQIVLIIIYILIIGFFVGLFASSYFTVGIQISLSENEVIEGNEVGLFYEINNKDLFNDLNSVKFTYWVVSNDITVVSEETVEIDKISRLDSYKSGVDVDLSNLEKGKYTIWTKTSYYLGEGGQGIGNKESKELSLNVYII